MQTFLPICVGLIFLSSLSAQPEVPGDQCLGGTLIAIQRDSITTKFNQKIITMHLAPDAEIWRRGADLSSTNQLVVGDQIYLKCAHTAGGEVVASMVAAAEKDDGIELVPHQIAEIRVCGGKLIAIEKDTLSARNDDGICVIHLKPGSEIWRGEIFHDTSALKLGDEIGARVTVSYPSEEVTAETVEANVAKTEGTIISVRPDRIVVRDSSLPFLRRNQTVLFDQRTRLELDGRELKKGANVLATGLDLGHNKFRATLILLEN